MALVGVNDIHKEPKTVCEISEKEVPDSGQSILSRLTLLLSIFSTRPLHPRFFLKASLSLHFRPRMHVVFRKVGS
jgi:hypothetical protein